MTYPEVIKYLESFINYEKTLNYSYKESLKLGRVKDFLATIGNPQNTLRCIHIAGTKGKGSTCAFIAYILRQAGYNVGLYTSPHLSDFRERIRILLLHQVQKELQKDFEGMISQNALTDLIERFRPAIEKYNQNSIHGPLSFFEVYTSLALVYFKEKKVDFAVLETGLGGRLDATNVVNPCVCAITPISYEHTQKLGNTLKEIAAEKAGIIKVSKCSAIKTSADRQSIKVSKLVVINAPQEEEALQVIREKCQKVGAKLYEVGKDIIYQKTNSGFRIKGIFGEYPGLKIRLAGEHQLINATVAIGVIEALRFYNINPVRNTKAIREENKISNGVNVDIDSLKKGLYNTLWPGRCEVISRNPLVVLDGAQNVASSRALKETIRENFSAFCARDASALGRGGKYKRLILVLGISDDKDIKGMCNELAELADEVVLTKANNPRASSPETLAKYFNGKVAHKTNNVKEAQEISQRIANKEDLILVTGSLFVVGEFRDAEL